MIYFIIFILTILSCLIFDNLGVVALVRKLTNSYKSQLTAMKDTNTSDEEKQKLLLQQVSKQMGYLLKLIGSILLFISPFLLLFLLEQYFTSLDVSALYSLVGISVSLVAVVLYIVLKKQYVKLYSNRENTP